MITDYSLDNYGIVAIVCLFGINKPLKKNGFL
jgi:hypothetical protein